MDQQKPTRESEEFLEDLAEELSVSPSRYEQAERSYKSLGDWLHRDASSVRQYGPKVYVQGSFRLGTTIRPSNDAEEYDIDSVCEFQKLSKALTDAAATEDPARRGDRGLSQGAKDEQADA